MDELTFRKFYCRKIVGKSNENGLSINSMISRNFWYAIKGKISGILTLKRLSVWPKNAFSNILESDGVFRY